MKIHTEDLESIEKAPIELFYDGIRSPETKEKYTRTLQGILCNMLEDVLQGSFDERAAQLVNKARESPQFALSVLLAISRKLKERTNLLTTDPNYLNPISIQNYFKPIKKLFDMNGVAVVWKRVYATFPELNNKSSGRAYTREEIAKTVKFSKGSIDRAIILVASSSGIREGGFKLRWQDLRPVYKVDGKLVFEVTESEVARAEIVCGILAVYSGTNEEYPAFITPEAYAAIQDHKMSWIKNVGREPKPQEPIFKEEGDLPIMLKPTAIKRRIERVLKESGLRTPLPKGKRRHEVPVMNGFRRFFNKINKETISQDSPLAALIKKEYMMDHIGLVKLDRNYYQAHLMELVEEYLNAVPDLTVSDEARAKAEAHRLRKRNRELEEKSNEIQYLKKSLEKMKDERSRDRDSMKVSIKEELEKLGIDPNKLKRANTT